MKLFSQEALETTESVELSVQEVQDLVEKSKAEPKARKKREVKPKEESASDLKYELEKEEDKFLFFEAERVQREEYEQKFKQDVVIDNDFIMRDDLHEWIFIEDSEGNRYRERIMDKIKEFGIENWFKAKGYPLNEDSVWKNRHTASLTTLKDDIHQFDNEFRTGTFEEQAYYLWEHWLPLDIWNEKEMNLRNLYTEITLSKSKITELKMKLWDLREPFTPLLNKWKEFIVNYCKEKEQEIEMIGFNESAPYDCEISVRMKGHYCYYSCISFRFNKGNLVAYDGLGGGTSFLGGFGSGLKTEQETESEIKELLDKVFNHECDEHHADFYNVDTTKPAEHRNIKIDEKGWIYYDN